jgi:serine/threonine-protein kinase
MSPEQACGTRDAVHPLSDQYALGVVLYEMLTGARPYEDDEDGHAIAKLIAGKPFPSPRQLRPELPEALEAVVLRALQYERDARFASVEDMVRAARASIERGSKAELPAPRPPPILHTLRMGPPDPADPPPSTRQIDTVPIPSVAQRARAPMPTVDPDATFTPFRRRAAKKEPHPSLLAYAFAAFGPAAIVFAIFALWPRATPISGPEPPPELPSPPPQATSGEAAIPTPPSRVDASATSTGTPMPSATSPGPAGASASSQPPGTSKPRSSATAAPRTPPGPARPCVSKPGAPCL